MEKQILLGLALLSLIPVAFAEVDTLDIDVAFERVDIKGTAEAESEIFLKIWNGSNKLVIDRSVWADSDSDFRIQMGEKHLGGLGSFTGEITHKDMITPFSFTIGSVGLDPVFSTMCQEGDKLNDKGACIAKIPLPSLSNEVQSVPLSQYEELLQENIELKLENRQLQSRVTQLTDEIIKMTDEFYTTIVNQMNWFIGQMSD